MRVCTRRTRPDCFPVSLVSSEKERTRDEANLMASAYCGAPGMLTGYLYTRSECSYKPFQYNMRHHVFAPLIATEPENAAFEQRNVLMFRFRSYRRVQERVEKLLQLIVVAPCACPPFPPYTNRQVLGAATYNFSLLSMLMELAAMRTDVSSIDNGDQTKLTEKSVSRTLSLQSRL